MMIYHRFMRASGHFYLLNLISWYKYPHYQSLRQTTLRAASHDKNSCIDRPENDQPTAIAQQIARLRGGGPASELLRCGEKNHGSKFWSASTDRPAHAYTGLADVACGFARRHQRGDVPAPPLRVARR